MTPTPTPIEPEILACWQRVQRGEIPWSELVQMIASRSPERVAEMERERGLA